MADIVLSTLNAKYIHAAFGLRYLFANLGPLQPRASLAEFDINQRPLEIAEAILACNPKIICFGVFIWNVAPTAEVLAIIRRVSPEITIILGGPEVSHETEGQGVVALADYVITGEADLKFAEICGQLLRGERPLTKIIPAEPPEFSRLVLPYELYTDEDIAHRVVYVEASRGCPFSCEFCLSSLDVPVRQAPLAVLCGHLQRLLDRGARQLKFVDRTFNLDTDFSRAILEFLLDRYRPGLFFHFEIVPDHLPEALRELVARFPAGALQFEAGVQTFNEQAASLIQRRQNQRQLEETFRFLREQTGVYIHADLIAGLPGEDLESFAMGFDRLIGLGPQEIQVGILKRLRGTSIGRHDTEWQMVYSPLPPYELLRNRLIDFATMQKMRRFARYWDLVGNSGNFVQSTPLIWGGADRAANRSPFKAFMNWSEWLYARVGRTNGIALPRLMVLLFDYLTGQREMDPKLVAETMWRDYQGGGRRDKPEFLKDFLPAQSPRARPAPRPPTALKRQARHRLVKPEIQNPNLSYMGQSTQSPGGSRPENQP